MSQTVKETFTTEERMPATPVMVHKTGSSEASAYQTAERLVYFFFGALEILLAFRLILMITGASLSSDFVSAIYNFTKIFVLPFDGIFRTGVAQVENSTNLVFEPSTLVAIVVYAVLALGIGKLLRVISGERQE